jgi:DNA ligase (NAD+)
LDIGPVVAKSIFEWFEDRENLKFLEKLEKVVKIINSDLKIKNNKLKNLTFVITGSLENMTRDEVRAKIRELGGNVSESVSKNTDYVIVGSEPGSKAETAKKLEVKILSEQEFLEMLR